MNLTISDFICPKCKSNNCTSYNIDEVDFCEDGTGHVYFDCTCLTCYHAFRQCYNFKYTITEDWSR